MNKHFNIFILALMLIIVLSSMQTFIMAMDPLKFFIPFSGDLTVAYTASTIQYNDKIKSNTSILEEPPTAMCIGSGGFPCVCTDCKCCTSDCPACKASPVITGGAYERRDTDFTIQGRGFPFEFTRYYYSSGKSIGSLGLAWTSVLDMSLVMVGDTRAFFQTERETIEFSGSDSNDCSAISYTVLNKSKAMIIKGIILENQKCYYQLTDYDNERKYVFYKDAKFNDQYNMKGSLRKECDFYNNCWEFEYEDLTGTGRIAPQYIKNYSGSIYNNAYAEFIYLPLEFPNPGQAETPYLLSEIDAYESGDTAGRKWYYSYITELVNYAESVSDYVFIGAQGVYPRLKYVAMLENPPLWQYAYYSRSSYDTTHFARPALLEHVIDRTGREVAHITYYTTDNYVPTDPRLSRVKTVINEEGTLDYTYTDCGALSNEGFCKTINKTVNGASAPYKIEIDGTTGYIKNVTNPGPPGQPPDQQYCYYSDNKKIAYFGELFDMQGSTPIYHYTRYEYDPDTGALSKLVRNACPFTAIPTNPCEPDYTNCSISQELAWQYDYELDNGLPIKIKSITAPAAYQSWKYDYYTDDPAGNPDWTLHYIYRKDPSQPDVYQKVSEFTYYSDGLLNESKDALDKATTYMYYNNMGDTIKNGKLKSVQYPANNDNSQRPAYKYSYCYNCADQVIPPAPHYSGEIITDPAGKQTFYYYDKLERLEKIKLPDPGNGATGFTTTMTYDVLPGDGSRCTDSKDANGIITRSCYDQYNNLIKQIQDYGTQSGHTNITTQYTYQNGLLSSIKDANNYTTSYYYDDMRRLKGIDYQDTWSSPTSNCPVYNADYDTCYYYYRNGQLSQKVDTKRQSLYFGYDAMGRLAWKDYLDTAGTHDMVYTYGGQNLFSVTDNRQNRTTSYTYDNFFRTKSITTPEGAISYDYELNDRMKYYQIGAGGAQINYSYYDDGSVKQISRASNAISYTYSLTGQRASLTYPFSASPAIQYSYDSQGRLTQIQNFKKASGNPTPLSTYTYSYDYNQDTQAPTFKGFRTKMDEYVSADPPANRIEKYNYDNLYQLTKSKYEDLPSTYQWSYDDIGNRWSQTISSSEIKYSYYRWQAGCLHPDPIDSKCNSQLLQYDGTSKCYIWDLNGNLRCTKPAASANECPPLDNPHSDSACPTSPLVAGEALYTWDEDDRLIDLKWYDTEYHHAQYFYDFNGNRYKKIVGNQTNQTTSYLYNGEDIVREIIDSNNFKEYIHNPGIDDPGFMLICSDSTCSTPHYYFADGLGSIRQIIDDSGTSIIENQYRYGAWGELSSLFTKSENIANPYAYTAREFAENKLYYYRARYYAGNELNIFIAPDKIKRGKEKFHYCVNNPANFLDPMGLFNKTVDDRSCRNNITRVRNAADEAERRATHLYCPYFDYPVVIRCCNTDRECEAMSIPLDENGHRYCGYYQSGIITLNFDAMPQPRCGIGGGCLSMILFHEFMHECGKEDCEAVACTNKHSSYNCQYRPGNAQMLECWLKFCQYCPF